MCCAQLLRQKQDRRAHALLVCRRHTVILPPRIENTMGEATYRQQVCSGPSQHLRAARIDALSGGSGLHGT